MELNRKELIVLIRGKFIPFSKMEEIKPLITFDRDGPIWDEQKLKVLTIDQLKILYTKIREWKFLGFWGEQ